MRGAKETILSTVLILGSCVKKPITNLKNETKIVISAQDYNTKQPIKELECELGNTDLGVTGKENPPNTFILKGETGAKANIACKAPGYAGSINTFELTRGATLEKTIELYK